MLPLPFVVFVVFMFGQLDLRIQKLEPKVEQKPAAKISISEMDQ